MSSKKAKLRETGKNLNYFMSAGGPLNKLAKTEFRRIYLRQTFRASYPIKQLKIIFLTLRDGKIPYP